MSIWKVNCGSGSDRAVVMRSTEASQSKYAASTCGWFSSAYVEELLRLDWLRQHRQRRLLPVGPVAAGDRLHLLAAPPSRPWWESPCTRTGKPPPRRGQSTPRPGAGLTVVLSASCFQKQNGTLTRLRPGHSIWLHDLLCSMLRLTVVALFTPPGAKSLTKTSRLPLRLRLPRRARV